ncbi:hypothetical protein K440DRAFT_288352 [Wilcoxina mikolae CBS 423.85]|nr:hypothetical protein K440DRAFT_288352 [Wilcoxina mikolae CBS 423.85]
MRDWISIWSLYRTKRLTPAVNCSLRCWLYIRLCCFVFHFFLSFVRDIEQKGHWCNGGVILAVVFCCFYWSWWRYLGVLSWLVQYIFRLVDEEYQVPLTHGFIGCAGEKSLHRRSLAQSYHVSWRCWCVNPPMR